MENEVKETALNKLHGQVLGNIHDLKNFLFSEVLNITDSIARDDVQRKALKEQVRKAVWGQEYFSEGLNWLFQKFAEAKKLEYKPQNPYPTVSEVVPNYEEKNYYEELA